jgi:hypothetical protein
MKGYGGHCSLSHESRRSTLKTGEREASTDRCAWNVSPLMMNDTCVPSLLSSRLPICSPRLEGGTPIELFSSSVVVHINLALHPSHNY